LGPIDDLTDEYRRARVFIAPTRFAAGIPFKVDEALSYGLPVVCSALLSEQLGFAGDFPEMVISTTVNDDGTQMAGACLRLLTGDRLWLDKRQKGIDYIRRFCAPTLLHEAITKLMAELDT
jgi:glycosyltransferase involved in cell wall biosynthesis